LPRAKRTSTSARRGGEAGIRKLADLLGREVKPLSAEHGVEKPRSVALIDENFCIGCTLCIQACPVDAIIGASKQMHTVIPRLCTGCELCIEPCPGGLHHDGARGGNGGHLEVALPGVCAEATGKAGRLMLHKLFQFNGGVKPTTHKAESTREPIARLPLPRELVIPLHQSIGGDAAPAGSGRPAGTEGTDHRCRRRQRLGGGACPRPRAA
jgi:NAD-dependent dihydropyrimidine dehydrogenase PreA subunit